MRMRQPSPARRGGRRWSLKWRLSLLLTSLFLVLFLLASAAFLVRAKKAIGSESRAAAQLTSTLLGHAPRRDGLPVVRQADLPALRGARHIRVDAAAATAASNTTAPAWFARLIHDDSAQWSQRIWVDREPPGAPVTALVRATPDDELAEKWGDVVEVFWFLSLLLAVLNVGAWVIVHWQLRPLRGLQAALGLVGTGALDARVALSDVQELAVVEEGFNAMAVTLQEAAERNRRLTRQLLSVQEDERRSIARELHDEFAQQLTAIDVNAAALSRGLAGDAAATATLASIRTGAGALMRMVRGRLETLRPELLEDFGILVAVEELFEAFRARHPDLALTLELPRLLPMSEECAITVYRVLQECLTNVTRHAAARRVHGALELLDTDGSCVLCLSVADDGVGMAHASSSRLGLGLLGIKERLESLGGTVKLGVGLAGRGLLVRGCLPLLGGARAEGGEGHGARQ